MILLHYNEKSCIWSDDDFNKIKTFTICAFILWLLILPIGIIIQANINNILYSKKFARENSF
jgi:hypothetical protein